MQAAIEHNRRVFANRVRMEDRAIMKKAFDAWRAVRFGSIAKQQLLRRAIARLQRGLLSRAFLAWKDKFHLVDKYHAMRKKVGTSRVQQKNWVGKGAREGGDKCATEAGGWLRGA